jgi:hypothetical protein
MDTSLLVITVGFATLGVAIVMLAATNINRRRLDSMIGTNSSKSLEQRLMELSKAHEELAASVSELKLTVQTILSLLH